jgi:hypothetical protein
MGDNMKYVFFPLLIGLLFSCSISSVKNDVDPDRNIGWLHGNCLAINDPFIEYPLNFTLVDLGPEQKIRSATIVGRSQSGDDCYALMDDRKNVNIGAGYSFYKIESKAPVNLAIGFLQINDSDGVDFEYCSTTEGISFSVFRYKTKVWEGYYYLGYESEATCQDKSNRVAGGL